MDDQLVINAALLLLSKDYVTAAGSHYVQKTEGLTPSGAVKVYSVCATNGEGRSLK